MENEKIEILKKRIKIPATIELLINLAEAIALFLMMASLTISIIGALFVSTELKHSGDGLGLFLGSITFAFSGIGLAVAIPGVIISGVLIWCVIDSYRNVNSENYMFGLWALNIVLIILLLFPAAILGNSVFKILMIVGAIGIINTIVISKMKKKINEAQSMNAVEAEKTPDMIKETENAEEESKEGKNSF